VLLSAPFRFKEYGEPMIGRPVILTFSYAGALAAGGVLAPFWAALVGWLIAAALGVHENARMRP